MGRLAVWARGRDSKPSAEQRPTSTRLTVAVTGPPRYPSDLSLEVNKGALAPSSRVLRSPTLGGGALCLLPVGLCRIC